MNKTTVIHEL